MLLGKYSGLPADPMAPLRAIREAVEKKTRVLGTSSADLRVETTVRVRAR